MGGTSWDVIVIGAGPGGYVAAVRAAQRGLRVACCDPNELLGGTCLRVGCIPSKVLLESSDQYHRAATGLAVHGISVGPVSFDLSAMMARKEKIVTTLGRGVESLFRKYGVTRVRGTARLTGPGRVSVDGPDAGELTAERILLAAGSLPAAPPGVVLDGARVVGSTEALAFDAVPAELIVLGAGAIGLELGSIWARLGSRVTVIELLDRILPGVDREIADAAQRVFAKQGMSFRLGRRVTSARAVGERAELVCEGESPQQADKVLVAVGRRANSAGLGLEAAGVQLDERGRVIVSADYATSVPGVYAIGDLVAGPMLAHRAEQDAIACVEGWFGEAPPVDYGLVPGVVYTEPEVASVGHSEESLQAAGLGYVKGSCPYRPNGRARAMERLDGQVKVLADDRHGAILGVHAVGPLAGELIAEAVCAMQLGGTIHDLAHLSHAHPTLAETLREAARAAAGQSVLI